MLDLALLAKIKLCALPTRTLVCLIFGQIVQTERTFSDAKVRTWTFTPRRVRFPCFQILGL